MSSAWFQVIQISNGIEMNILQIPKNFETSYGGGAKDAESVKNQIGQIR